MARETDDESEISSEDIDEWFQSDAKRSQEEVIEFITRNCHSSGKIIERDFNPEQIEELIHQVYNFEDHKERNFYSQSRGGIPNKTVPTVVAGKEFFCTLALENVLGGSNWKWTTEPEAIRKQNV
jgi:hypothetical protein